MPEKKILLIGGGGHCRACVDVIEANKAFAIAGIVEQQGSRTTSVMGYPVIGCDNDLETLKNRFDYAAITIGQMGSSRIRQTCFNLLKTLGFSLPVIVSPLARVSPHAGIEEGTMVMHHVIVNAGARIGANCILNTRSLIEHDAQIGEHTHISTAAVVNGQAKVGSGSFVGSNATIVQGVRLPDGYYVRAGRVVTSPKDGQLIKDNTA